MEFVVWYIKGFQAFDQFSKDRATEDNSPIKEDVYFKLVNHAQGTNAGFVTAAMFKKAVALVGQMKKNSFSRELLTVPLAI